MSRSASACLFATLLAAISAPAVAEQVNARYDVLVGGLLVGKASISGDISQGAYKLSLNATMTGLVGAITGGKGSAASSGVISGGRVLSSGYALKASNGSQSRSIQIGMSGGNATRVVVSPAFVVSPERAPITDQQRKGVVDPLAALLMPVKGGSPFAELNCNRTIPVFDGAQRFNVKLSFARMDEVKVNGYQGPVLVCSARYVPLGGHFPKRPQTKFRVENRDVSAWRAPVAGGAILAPVQINVKTAVGNTVMIARSFPGAQDVVPTGSVGQ